VARDISPRLLLVTGSMVLIFDNQDLDGFGPRKQWQSVRHGPDGFTAAIPRHEDPADSGYRAACWKNDDRTARAQDKRLRKSRRAGRMICRIRAPNHDQVRVIRMHADLSAHVRQGSPFRLDSETADHALEQGPMLRLNRLDFCSVDLHHALHAFAPGERLRRSNCGLGLHEYAN
jgi:hypothetical protein